MPTRIFLMFDYGSTGIWYASDEVPPRPAGVVEPDEVGLSATTKAELAAWVERVDRLNTRKWMAADEPDPTEDEWAAEEDERQRLWRVIRLEAGPEWEVGIRTAGHVVWSDDAPPE